MKKFVALIFLVICCQISNAQILPTTLSVDGKSVSMDVKTYRDLKEKYYACDTSLKQKDNRIKNKDSTIVLLQDKIKHQNMLIVQKDTTIQQLNENNNKAIEALKKANKREKNILKNAPAWMGVTFGIVFGFLLAR